MSGQEDLAELTSSIDTPGVIDRVSTLFRGHPSLIQGFNTFLPPGYRIECTTSEGDTQGLITVTTPTGTVSQMPGGFTAAIDKKDREARDDARARENAKRAQQAAQPAGQSLPPLHSQHVTGPYGQPATSRAPAQPPTPAPASRPGGAAPGPLPLPPHGNALAPASGPSTPSAAQFLASGLGSVTAAAQAANPSRPGNVTPGPQLEFNHAITFVNKIKNRFNSDPDTYKQFLEILQTYQKDGRDIAEVSQYHVSALIASGVRASAETIQQRPRSHRRVQAVPSRERIWQSRRIWLRLVCPGRAGPGSWCRRQACYEAR